MIYIDIAPKSSFHPRYRIFPYQPFSFHSRSLLYYTSMPPIFLAIAVTSARPFIPNKAISYPQRERRRPLLATVLGDNLYTRATYVITYSLDTSFSRVRRRFHGFVPSRLVTARGSHCCLTIRKIARVHTFESKARILFLLTVVLFVILKITGLASNHYLLKDFIIIKVLLLIKLK